MSEEKEQAEIDERKPLRKLDLNILPGVILLFLLSFLDLSNGNLSPSLSTTRLPLIVFQSEMPVSRVSPQIHT